jgi:hypothetical protein
MEQAKNIKLLLCVFKQLPGLKINFHNNKIFYFREANIMGINILNFFCCEVGSYPGLDKKLVKLARWLGTKVLRLDSFFF